MSGANHGLVSACGALLMLIPVVRAEPPRTDLYGDPLPDDALLRLGTVQWRHNESVCALRFVDGGKALLAADADGVLYCWERATGRLLWRLGGGQKRASAVALSADGKTFAALWLDGIRVWDVTARKERGSAVGKPDWNSKALALSADGSLVATQAALEGDNKKGDFGLGVWEVTGGKLLYQFSAYVGSVAFSPDGRTFAFVGGGTHAVHVGDVRSGTERRTLELEHPVKAVTFSPDGKTLAVCGYYNVFWLLDPDSGKLRHRCGADDHAVASVLAISPDGKTVAHATDEVIGLWDTATGEELRTLPGRQGRVRALAFSPDGKTLASGGDGRTVALWDVATGAPAAPVEGHQSKILAAAFAPGGRTLASASEDGTVRLWDMATGKELRRIDAGENWSRELAFTPDGKTLISSGRDPLARWWTCPPDGSCAAGEGTRMGSTSTSPQMERPGPST